MKPFVSCAAQCFFLLFDSPAGIPHDGPLGAHRQREARDRTPARAQLRRQGVLPRERGHHVARRNVEADHGTVGHGDEHLLAAAAVGGGGGGGGNGTRRLVAAVAEAAAEASSGGGRRQRAVERQSIDRSIDRGATAPDPGPTSLPPPTNATADTAWVPARQTRYRLRLSHRTATLPRVSPAATVSPRVASNARQEYGTVRLLRWLVVVDMIVESRPSAERTERASQIRPEREAERSTTWAMMSRLVGRPGARGRRRASDSPLAGSHSGTSQIV